MEPSKHRFIVGHRKSPQIGDGEVTNAVLKFCASGGLIGRLPDELVPIRDMVEPRYQSHAMNSRGAQ